MPKDIDYYEVALYNKGQMFLPNPKIFGTDMLRIKLPDEARSVDNGTSYNVYRQDFRMTQIHWKALDNAKQRCDDKHSSLDVSINTTACIVEYLEKEINCSMVLKSSKYHKIR